MKFDFINKEIIFLKDKIINNPKCLMYSLITNDKIYSKYDSNTIKTILKDLKNKHIKVLSSVKKRLNYKCTLFVIQLKLILDNKVYYIKDDFVIDFSLNCFENYGYYIENCV